MSRSLVTLATVISIHPLGENNASVTFLTQNEGIIYAVMYGGPKSKMKSLVSPWNTGTAYFSLTNQKNYKISDFDVKNYHLTFRENLRKSWTANLAAEIAIKTKCAGSTGKAWALINGFLDGLELCTTDAQCTAGLIRFLWRYLEIMGIQPDTTRCCHCGEIFTAGAGFNPGENGFCCPGCCQKKSPFMLTQDGIEYLNAISHLTPQEVRTKPLLAGSVSSIKELVFYLTENACGAPLSSLKTGTGIL